MTEDEMAGWHHGSMDMSLIPQAKELQGWLETTRIQRLRERILS